MIQLTTAQLEAWIAFFIYPAARVLALMAAAPVFNNLAVPRNVRLAVGLAVIAGIAPALPPLPPISPASGVGIAVLAQQILIGLAMGFAMRIAFAAVDVAGELIGLQMGLSFAVFFDPQSSGQTAVVSEFLGLLATLVFLALDGHLMVISVLARSFTLLPVSSEPPALAGLEVLVHWGATLFSAGVLLALPLIAALLITNISLGVLTRAAPQLNLFAVGFPVTLIVGFVLLLLVMPLFAPATGRLFEQALELMQQLAQFSAPGLAP